MTTNLIERLTEELAPTDEALARIRARVDQSMAAPPRPVARPGRSRRVLVAAVAGAAMVALVVAMSPFESGGDRRGVPATASAQAALQRAADAAGEETWRPLGPGEFHHTMTTSIQPHIPPHDGDTTEHNRQPLRGATSTEVYLDRDGHGMQLRAMGGNGDPDFYVTPMKPDRAGRVGGFVFGPGADTPAPSIEASLRYAYNVDVSQWPRDGDPVRRLWYRTPTGYQTGSAMPDGAIPKSGLTLGERFQRDTWGTPIDDIDRLNDASGDALQELLDPILGTKPDGEIAIVGPLVQGDYDETDAWFAAQVEVQRAVTLLARAPLAPHVRQALFQRLAAHDHVTIEHDAKDELGRAGTRITFEWLLDEPVPAFTVTKEQLRQDAIDKQQPADGTITGPDLVRVPAHRSVGRWYQSIILRESTGEILQNVEWADWKTTVAVPRVATTTRRPRAINGIGWNVGIKHEPGWYGTLSGQAFGVRERTTSITNLQTAACSTTPAMCSLTSRQ